jgi:hypothetical protein
MSADGSNEIEVLVGQAALPAQMPVTAMPTRLGMKPGAKEGVLILPLTRDGVRAWDSDRALVAPGDAKPMTASVGWWEAGSPSSARCRSHSFCATCSCLNGGPSESRPSVHAPETRRNTKTPSLLKTLIHRRSVSRRFRIASPRSSMTTGRVSSTTHSEGPTKGSVYV